MLLSELKIKDITPTHVFILYQGKTYKCKLYYHKISYLRRFTIKNYKGILSLNTYKVYGLKRDVLK